VTEKPNVGRYVTKRRSPIFVVVNYLLWATSYRIIKRGSPYPSLSLTKFRYALTSAECDSIRHQLTFRDGNKPIGKRYRSCAEGSVFLQRVYTNQIEVVPRNTQRLWTWHLSIRKGLIPLPIMVRQVGDTVQNHHRESDVAINNSSTKPRSTHHTRALYILSCYRSTG
jgi:hypothetical protein